jgi:hypothetical protein
VLERGIRSKDFVDVDLDAAATSIVGVVLGIVTQWYFDPKAIDVEGAIAVACETIAARMLARPRRHA